MPPRLPVGSVQTVALQLGGLHAVAHRRRRRLGGRRRARRRARRHRRRQHHHAAAARRRRGQRPPAELVVGTRLWRLTAFALHGLQSDACAEAKAARGTAACAVLGGARLLRVRSVATHVLPSHVRFGVGGGSLLSHEAEAEVVAADADGGAYAHHALSLVLLEQLDAPDNFLLIHAKVRVLPSSGGGRRRRRRVGRPARRATDARRRRLANFALEPPSAAAAGALAPPLFGSHEFTYVGYGGVFDYAPATGTFRMWLVDADAVENRAPLLLPPLSAGTWAPLRRFVYVGHDWWLEYAPATGAYGLRRCEHATWKAGRCAARRSARHVTSAA